MTWEQSTCPICNSAAQRTFLNNHRVCSYMCRICKDFALWIDEQEDYLDDQTARNNYYPDRIAALLKERNIKNLPHPVLLFKTVKYGDIPSFVPVYVPDLLAEWPDTVPQRIDRCLCNLARHSPLTGQKIELQRWGHNDFLFFTKLQDEEEYYVNALKQYGWITVSENNLHLSELCITPKGWARFDELARGKTSQNNPVFVAMWFGGKQKQTEMTKLWQNGIRPAVKCSGYKVKRADSDEHNDYIMDKIRADIRKAPFVIADLTNQNQGVYYEAGLAAGLGLQVVHSCPYSEKSNVHFDIDQIKRVLYEDADDLRKKLTVHILGSIGEGPFSVPDNV